MTINSSLYCAVSRLLHSEHSQELNESKYSSACNRLAVSQNLVCRQPKQNFHRAVQIGSSLGFGTSVHALGAQWLAGGETANSSKASHLLSILLKHEAAVSSSNCEAVRQSAAKETMLSFSSICPLPLMLLSSLSLPHTGFLFGLSERNVYTVRL